MSRHQRLTRAPRRRRYSVFVVGLGVLAVVLPASLVVADESPFVGLLAGLVAVLAAAAVLVRVRILPGVPRSGAAAISALPPAPTNVQAHPSGREPVPLDCVYRGVDRYGSHVWVVVTPLPPAGDGPTRITCDELPPRTSVTFEMSFRPELDG